MNKIYSIFALVFSSLVFLSTIIMTIISRKKICKYRNINKLTPVQWAEANRVLTKDISSYGKMPYNHLPYLIEVANSIMQSGPSQIIPIMKGAQLGSTNEQVEELFNLKNSSIINISSKNYGDDGVGLTSDQIDELI